MRLTRHQIKLLSEELAGQVQKLGLAKLNVPAAEAVSVLEKALTDDLMVEDRLNDEVREMLKGYSKEIEQGKMDYKTMFDLVKKKLVHERGLVL